MKKGISLLIVSLILGACAKDKYVYLQGDPTITPPVTEQNKVDAVIVDENQHRFLNGQTLLTQGLICSLYTITGGQTILTGANQITGKTLIGTYTYKGTFNQSSVGVNEGLNVLPEPFKSTYKQMLYLTCSGQIVVTQSAYYEFSLASDDGSLLYIDGTLLLNNDGNHGVTIKSGTKYLKKGIHSFKLDYAESGSGSLALTLTSNSALVDSMYFYH